MRCMRQAGFLKTGLQDLYAKVFFCKPYYGDAKVPMLRAGTYFYERKMHDLP